MKDILKGIKVQYFPPGKFTANPDQPREKLCIEHILPDAKECKHIRKPVVANLDFMLYQGHNRVECAKVLGFDTVPAILIDDSKLSSEEKLELLLDYSAERPLSKFEAFIAYCKWVVLGFGEKAAFRKCRAILDLAFGPVSPEKLVIAKAVAESSHEDAEVAIEEAAFSKHRGTVQNMFRLARLPAEVQAMYCQYWKTGKSDLTTADVKELAKEQSEMLAKQATDSTLTIDAIEAEIVSKANARAEANRAEASGDTTAPRMRKRSDVEAMAANPKADAKIRKALAWVLGNLSNEELLKD